MTSDVLAKDASKDLKRKNPLSALKEKLRARPDSEHEMTLNRLVNNIVVLVYFSIASYFHVVEAERVLAATYHLFVLYNLASIGLFVHIMIYPGISRPRRMFAMCMDLSMICYVMHVGDHATALLYPFILWTIFGNGFRFGRKYLLAATIISLIEFGLVVATTEFWREFPALSAGLLIGLIILPAYVSLLIRKLSEAIDQAQAANRAKSMFLASISHELRTPLTAIIGLSDLLRDTRLTNEQSEMNETVRESGKSLLNLINSILDLSRLEVGKMPKQAQKVDLYALLHRTVEMISVPARAKNVHSALHIESTVPRHISVSRKHIEDSIINLASNAVKFTASGYVLIRVTSKSANANNSRIRIEVTDTGIGIAESAQARIFERFTQADDSIVDKFGGTGLGLATVKQMIEDIGGSVGVTSTMGAGSTFWLEFDASEAENETRKDWKDYPVITVSDDVKLLQFVEHLVPKSFAASTVREAKDRVDQLAETERLAAIVFLDGRSTGVGFEDLALTFQGANAVTRPRLVAVIDDYEQFRPHISPVNYATAVARPISLDTIANALVISAGPVAEGAQNAGSPESPNLVRPLHILLADDNKTNQKVIGKMLSKAGHRVAIVDNGQQAVSLMQEQHFDIALFDVNMPVLNGVDAAKLYRFSALGADPTPIVALTADATPETEMRCHDAGMVKCLTKPVHARQLLDTILTIVASGEARNTVAIQSSEDAESNAKRSGDETHKSINYLALNDLIELGGKEFALEIVLQFVADGSKVMLDLIQAVSAGDAARFGELVHALRSGAANVGAQRIFELCHEWRQLSASELSLHGDDYMNELRGELERAEQLLQDHLSQLQGHVSIREAAGNAKNSTDGEIRAA